MTDIICKCGHPKNVHPADDGELTYMVCDGCFRANRPEGIKQLNSVDCEEYIPDNLTHIEVLAKAKGLI